MVKTTQSFCQPLEFLNFLSRYPLSRVCSEECSSFQLSVVFRCQQTWTDELDRWFPLPAARESTNLKFAKLKGKVVLSGKMWAVIYFLPFLVSSVLVQLMLCVSDLSRASSEPEMDLRLMNLLGVESSRPF